MGLHQVVKLLIASRRALLITAIAVVKICWSEEFVYFFEVIYFRFDTVSARSAVVWRRTVQSFVEVLCFYGPVQIFCEGRWRELIAKSFALGKILVRLNCLIELQIVHMEGLF